MKTIISAALIIGCCGLTWAEDAKKAADPVGTWNFDYEIRGIKRTAKLTIKKDGDKLFGTMNWPDQKNETITNVKFKEDVLTFSAVRQLMGNEIGVDYALTIDGDDVSGTGTSKFRGRRHEWEISGKRDKSK